MNAQTAQTIATAREPRAIVPAPKRWPTAFAAALRMCVFQPTTSPRQCERTIQTHYGPMTSIGRAGQGEAGLHDALMYVNRMPEHPEDAGAVRYEALHPSTTPLPGTPFYKTSTGNPFLVAELEQCRKLLARREGGRGRSITCPLDRLLGLTVSLSATGRDRGVLDARGHLLDEALSIREGGRTYILAILGSFDIALLAGDVARFFDPRPLAQMKSGVAQAAARFLLSHDPAHWAGQGEGYKLDTVLRSIGVAPGSAFCKARNDVRAEAGAVAALGFELTDDDHFIVTSAKATRAEWWHRRHAITQTAGAAAPGLATLENPLPV